MVVLGDQQFGVDTREVDLSGLRPGESFEVEFEPLEDPSWSSSNAADRSLMSRISRSISSVAPGDVPKLVIIGLLVLAGLTYWAVSATVAHGGAPVEQEIPLAVPAGDPTPTTTIPSLLVVHVVGEVASAGLVEVPPGSRVADVLAAAGGPTEVADVARLNLAMVVADGSKITVPAVGTSLVGALVETPNNMGSDQNSGGLVNVNTAPTGELATLKGIGPSLAGAIVKHRELRGPFSRPDDLLKVPGIGPAKLEGFRDRLKF